MNGSKVFLKSQNSNINKNSPSTNLTKNYKKVILTNGKKVPYTENNSADLIRDRKDVSYQPSTISLIKHCSPQKELSHLQKKFERFFSDSESNTQAGIPQIVVHTAFGN